MHKLGDNEVKFCQICQNKQIFEITSISEFGEIYGKCNNCNKIIKF